MALKIRKTDFDDLENAVERIRKQLYPNLDAGFLGAVLRAEEENPEDDAEAIRVIQKAVKESLTKKG